METGPSTDPPRRTPGSPDGEQDRFADEREHAADERERLADKREEAADQRERLADKRENAADTREGHLDRAESRSDKQAQIKGASVATHQQRSFEALSRSRALLESSKARLDRHENALRRSDARDDREQQEIDRELSASVRYARSPEELRGTALDERVTRLRSQFISTANALAAAHDAVASHHDKLRREDPDTGDVHRRRAEQAREAARQVRAAAQQAPEGVPAPPAPDGD